MKKIVMLAAAVLLLSCNQAKIAYIDIELLMKEYEATRSLEKNLTAKQDLYAQELDSLQAPFQLKLQEYYKTVDKMSASQKAKIESELQAEQQYIQQRQQQVTQLLQNENQIESDALTKIVDSIVAGYANKNGLKLILGSSGKGTVMFGDDSINITEDILEILNDSYISE